VHEARRAASGAVPALLARGRQSDMDGARGQARVILGVVRGACRGIVCDLMLLIEGCTPDELPERMIGGTRLRQGGVACVLACWRARVLACSRARVLACSRTWWKPRRRCAQLRLAARELP